MGSSPTRILFWNKTVSSSGSLTVSIPPYHTINIGMPSKINRSFIKLFDRYFKLSIFVLEVSYKPAGLNLLSHFFSGIFAFMPFFAKPPQVLDGL